MLYLACLCHCFTTADVRIFPRKKLKKIDRIYGICICNKKMVHMIDYPLSNYHSMFYMEWPVRIGKMEQIIYIVKSYAFRLNAGFPGKFGEAQNHLNKLRAICICNLLNFDYLTQLLLFFFKKKTASLFYNQ